MGINIKICFFFSQIDSPVYIGPNSLVQVLKIDLGGLCKTPRESYDFCECAKNLNKHPVSYFDLFQKQPDSSFIISHGYIFTTWPTPLLTYPPLSPSLPLQLFVTSLSLSVYSHPPLLSQGGRREGGGLMFSNSEDYTLGQVRFILKGYLSKCSTWEIVNIISVCLTSLG